jgi:hypothetical protein
MDPTDAPNFISDPHYVVDTAAALVLAAATMWVGVILIRFVARFLRRVLNELSRK